MSVIAIPRADNCNPLHLAKHRKEENVLVQRLKPLSQADHDTVQARLEVLATQIADIGNVIGPAFGAAWCDKALKLHRDILRLKMGLHAQTLEIFDSMGLGEIP